MKKINGLLLTSVIITVCVFIDGFGISRTDSAFRTPGTFV